MRLTLPCLKSSLHLLSLLSLLTLTLFLLLTPAYFTIPSVAPSWTFGLSGVEMPSGFIDYELMWEDCQSSRGALKACEFVKDFQQAGNTLTVALALLFVLETISVVHFGLTHMLVTLSIRTIALGGNVPRCVPSLSRVLEYVQYLTLVHPFLTLFSVICYPIQSRFPEVSSRLSLQAEPGLVILGAKSGLAIAVFAAVCIEIVENRRRNSRMLQEKKVLKPVFSQAESDKTALGAGSFDETRIPMRPVATMKPPEREYIPPNLGSVIATNVQFFPLQIEDSKCEEIVDEGPPSSWFNLAEISQMLEVALGLFLKELEVSPASDPSLELLISTEEFKVYGKETSRGLMLKTEWSVPYTPQVYVDFIKNFDKRKEWDKNIDEYRKVCYLSEDVSVNYQRYKKVMVVSARELLVACKSLRKEGGWIDVSCSVASPAFPIKPSIVRAHLHLGGYLVVPTLSGSSITALSEMDFGGSLPRSALKKITALGLLMFTKSLSAALATANSKC